MFLLPSAADVIGPPMSGYSAPAFELILYDCLRFEGLLFGATNPETPDITDPEVVVPSFMICVVVYLP